MRGGKPRMDANRRLQVAFGLVQLLLALEQRCQVVERLDVVWLAVQGGSVGGNRLVDALLALQRAGQVEMGFGRIVALQRSAKTGLGLAIFLLLVEGVSQPGVGPRVAGLQSQRFAQLGDGLVELSRVVQQNA